MFKIALTSLVSLTATTAIASEEIITIDRSGKSIVATLNLPDGVKNPPVVLMLHGFTGSRDEFTVPGTNRGLFALLAAEIAKAGIASLRIDFTGSGESSGNWQETTFSGQIADAVTAFDHLQTLDRVDGSRVGILGYSQGGLVGAHLASQRPEAAAVVLWAPVTNPMATYSTIMGADKIAAGLAAGDGEVIAADLSWGGQTTLGSAFFRELPSVSTAAALAGYPGPMRVIVGKNETIVAPQPFLVEQLLRYHPGVEDIVVLDSDHDFGAEKSDALLKSDLAPKTVEWFRDHL